MDCQWGDFGEWSQCSATCAGGTQSRSRDVKMSESNGGQSCSGQKTEQKDCNTQPCTDENINQQEVGQILEELEKQKEEHKQLIEEQKEVLEKMKQHLEADEAAAINKNEQDKINANQGQQIDHGPYARGRMPYLFWEFHWYGLSTAGSVHDYHAMHS